MKDMLIKNCGKCSKEICCNNANIEECICSTVRLSPQTQKFLSNTFFDCLCTNCLEELNRNVAHAGVFSFPDKKDEFIEGIHYYLDGNRWVFTELYHILKGTCCGNGCRHCVYGFKVPRKNSF